VEVNASPSLSTTTEADRIMKLSLLRDIYNIVAAGAFSLLLHLFRPLWLVGHR
jgi:hypothetical protein